MEQTRISALRGLIVLAAFLWLLPVTGRAQAAEVPVPLPPNTPVANETLNMTRAVDCDIGQTIQEAVNNSNSGDAVLVSGDCFENVNIGAGKRNIDIDGQGVATVNGPDPNDHTFRVRGQGITIRGFSSITGGLDGVHINRGGDAVVAGNTIHNTGRFGVVVEEGNSARIVNNTIRNNPSHGILAEENSSARIGFLSFLDTFPRPNTIRNNGGNGVAVNRSSSAVIVSNIIRNNTGNGVSISRASHADVGANTINANGTIATPRDGIFVTENSGVNIGQTGIVFDGPNSTTGGNNNTRNGIRCRLGAYVNIGGNLGTLNGSAGATDFDATCPVNP